MYISLDRYAAHIYRYEYNPANAFAVKPVSAGRYNKWGGFVLCLSVNTQQLLRKSMSMYVLVTSEIVFHSLTHNIRLLYPIDTPLLRLFKQRDGFSFLVNLRPVISLNRVLSQA